MFFTVILTLVRVSNGFFKKNHAFNIIFSYLFQEELDDEDDWNPSKASGVCLMLLANLCEDDVLPQVKIFSQYFQRNI